MRVIAKTCQMLRFPADNFELAYLAVGDILDSSLCEGKCALHAGAPRNCRPPRAALSQTAGSSTVLLPMATGFRVRRSLLLASGRFAMIDDGVGFSLVPWRPVIEARMGQSVSAIVRGPTVSLDIGRGLSR